MLRRAGDFFDKVADANWNLRWHQDSVIAVRERIETAGYTAWADKVGVTQVRPPLQVLQQMLAVRIHLDDCTRDNGPLRVLCGSHHQRWDRDQMAACRRQLREEICEVPSGGALVMRPLILHASGPAESPSHRRVVHIEYTHEELPGDLDWRIRI